MFTKILNRCGLFLFIITIGFSQVTIAPTSIFINSREPFGALLIMNGTDKIQEVSVSFPFGYPQSDSTGLISMNYGVSDMSAKYSIESYVNGFPKSFTLEPNKRQVIRLTVRPIDLKGSGTFWTRIKTTSTEIAPEIGIVPEGGITADIRFVFEQITSLFYQTGDLTTHLKINNLQTKIKGKEIIFIADLEKTGNTPYLGTMEVKIFDNSGVEINNNLNLISVYTSGARNIKIDTSDLPSGSYSADIKIYSSREDIPDRYNIITDPVISSIDFNL